MFTTMKEKINNSDQNQNIYTCSFCGKKEKGKPLTYLYPWARKGVKLDGSCVALRPKGWDWDIVPVKFTDSWSCGCHKFR